MNNQTTVTPEIISNVRFLVAAIVLVAVVMVSLILWLISEHNTVSDLEQNYHSASSIQLNNIRYETLKLQQSLAEIRNHSEKDDDLVRMNHNVIKSLYIITQTGQTIFSIQKQYQNPAFFELTERLQKQLNPLVTLIGEGFITGKLIGSVQLVNMDAILLTLYQLDRLHNITHKELTEKASEQEKQRVSIIFSFLVMVLLATVFFTYNTFGSIRAVLKDQKKAEEKLSQEKELIHTTLNSIGDAVITTNNFGQVTDMNPVAEKLTGWSLQESQGLALETVFPIIDATTRKPLENPVDKVLKTGEIIYLSNHTTLIAKDGTEYQIADSAAPIRDADNCVLGMVLVFNDVTEQYKMREDIRLSAQHLRLYQEQSPLAAIEWDLNFQVVDWNLAAEKMFGYKLEEIQGRNFVDVMLPEAAIVDAQLKWEELITQVGGTKSINENLRKDGSVILCEWHNTVIKDQSDKVVGAASIVLDITSEYKVQQELLKKEQEQREILNTIVDAVITIDETGIVLTCNKSAEKQFGYEAKEIVGENISQLMPDHFAGEHDSYLHHYLETGEAQIIGAGREVEGKRKNKEVFPMRLSVAELPVSAEGKRRFIGSCLDLTRHKQQEEQLRRTQKMDALGKLTSGISHDYNNMLGIINGYAQLLESGLGEQPKLARYAHEIYHAGQRGAMLTQKLLAFSKQKTSIAEKYILNTLIQEQQHMLEKTLTANIQLTLDLEDELWPVSVDIGDLEDTIINLSINAMHAIERSGEITIRTRNEKIKGSYADSLNLDTGEYVMLCVEDTGCGMDADTKENIFDPFYSTKGEEGTGLGLSQVYGFVERSHGAIKVNSDVGNGTQFILYFPRCIEASDNDQVASDDRQAMEYSGDETILVVDDEVALANLTFEILRQHGYNVFCTNSARQALGILEHEHVDLLFSDVIMPVMDGYELAAIVQSKYPAVKIQLASGFAGNSNAELIDEKLLLNLIRKPYNRMQLLQKVREVLDSE